MILSQSAECLRSAILFIAKTQKNNGGFASITAFHETDSSESHGTIFYPALIGTILSGISGTIAKGIIKNINYFLKSEMNQKGMWSYWEQNDTESQQPYPPDFDDTSLAIAVHIQNKNSETSMMVGYIQSLIEHEEKPGGPYRTWITGQKIKNWDDVDPVVNASIAYALKQENVTVRNLNDFLIDAIKQNKWRSPYYQSEPLILFLYNRALNGECDEEIRIAAESNAEKNNELSLLDSALTAITLIIAGSNREIILQCMDSLLKRSSRDGYAPDPCIIEKKDQKEIRLSGCAALSAAATALAFHSFIEYEKQCNPLQNQKITVETHLHDSVVETVAKKLHSFDQDLFSLGLEEFVKLIATPVAREITLISFDIGSAFGANIPFETYAALGVANLWGWLSYQLYDGCYDEGDISPNLSLGNICLREATVQYRDLAQKYKVPSELIGDTFNHIDIAHAHELKERCMVNASANKIRQWLAGSATPISEKSFGHCLGPQLVSWITHETPETKKQLRRLFTHYLNARQMCDDLHDWSEDYSAYRLTSVTKPLFLSSYAFSEFSDNQDKAENIFWQEGIGIAIRQTRRELETAEYILNKISWKESKPVRLSASIARLTDAIEQVTREHQNMRALIKHFT